RQMSICIAAAVLLVAPTGIGADRQTAGVLAGDVAGIDRAIEDRRQALQLPGVSVAIAMGGALVYAKGFGLADLENRRVVTPESRFRTASVAKPITATAVMQLAEAGRLDLDAPIQTYCPAFPQKPWPVTARQLLGHLAGVRHYAKPRESSGTEHYFAI